MKLKELGKILREERIRQGLNLNDIKESTKLSEYILQVIEDGRVEKMPVEVYARSFIKSYIKELGIEKGEVWDILEELYPVQKNEQEEIKASTVMLPGVLSDKHKKLIALVALSSFILIVIIWFSFSFVQKKRETRQSEEVGTLQQLPAETKIEMTEELAADEQDAVQSLVSEDGVDNENLSTPKMAEEKPTNVKEKQKSVVKAKKETALATSRTADSVEDTNAEVQQRLKITATDGECWFLATVDGREVERTLFPGRTMSFSFTQKIRLKVGNAPAVKLELNGKPYPIVGGGSVRILEFTADND